MTTGLVARRRAARQQSNTSPSAELACPIVKDKVREDKETGLPVLILLFLSCEPQFCSGDYRPFDRTKTCIFHLVLSPYVMHGVLVLAPQVPSTIASIEADRYSSPDPLWTFVVVYFCSTIE
jgi:hypothetical protein